MTTEQATPAAEQATPATRSSERGAATRSGLLAAARDVFISVGYAQAGVTDIVALAGASVGSLYYHFSGKADLYLALNEQLGSELAECTRAAVRRARDMGTSDPMQLFLVGARGYLAGCIENRELAALFARGDGPPGFDMVWRQGVADWVGRNTEYFARSGEPLEEAVAIVMTGAMMLAAAEASLAADAERARRIADSVIKVLSRLENSST